MAALVLHLLLSLFLATIANVEPHSHGIHNQIHLLRPQSGAGGSPVPGLSCQSWRLGVETHNIIGWATVPQECEGYVGHYMLGQQYRKDSKAVADEAIHFAESLKLAKDGKDIWVFDVDETTLSNLPYYAQHGFGVEPYNAKVFDEWVIQAKAVVLPESLRLYRKLLSLGIKPVFLTGRTEDKRNVTTTNLKNAGYHTLEMLILKGSNYSGKTATEYKSNERRNLEMKGFRIVGNSGDQWSDLLGTNVGNRTFKLPDPMYYIS
ncbi:acid phosphatase 1-like [Tripterygium wilfordii]|uniref:acid phosphatase 1-like n=1 Tax=Tripterygium wilfordii TaxID=458696 RepID=UPI0018F84D3B|nr:acid phosphatase 1-like [Tripterygium wilfordii]